MASMEEVIERLTRLEEKTDAQKEDVRELKATMKEIERKVNAIEKKTFFLWVVATGGLGILYSVFSQKLKSLVGGHS